MKHIVFVLGSYYPRFSAVGVCAHRVIEALKADYRDFKISVVAIAGEDAEEPRIRLDGIDIYRVTTPEIIARNRLKHRLRSRRSAADRLWMLMLRVRSTLRRLFASATIDVPLVRVFSQQLEELGNIDVVVPLVLPFESVLAALDYASVHEDVRVVPYLFDNFVESASLHVVELARTLKQPRHLQLEADMIAGSATVLAMHPLRRHFEKFFDGGRLEKIRFLEHPLLLRSQSPAHSRQGKTSLVYTGALMHRVRDADYLVELLRGLDGPPMEIDFYVMGNAAGKIKSETTGAGIQIRNFGQVSKAEAMAAVARATILLSIGEFRGQQISSKIFEYMATGKPIIHLTYVEDDVDSKILAKYPLALILLQTPTLRKSNRQRMQEFIRRHSASSLDFETVAALYPEALPSATAEVIADIVESDGR